MTGERAIDDEGAHAATSSFTGRWLGAFGTRFSDVFDHIFFLPAGRFLAASGRNDMQRATLTGGPVQSGMGAALARLLDHVLPFSTTSFVRGSLALPACLSRCCSRMRTPRAEGMPHARMSRTRATEKNLCLPRKFLYRAESRVCVESSISINRESISREQKPSILTADEPRPTGKAFLRKGLTGGGGEGLG